MRVTLQKIAEETGVSIMSVSLALRRTGRLSGQTRRKILETAERLGYQPDPALSALVHYRLDKKQRQFQSTIAFITHFEGPSVWKKREYVLNYFEGASLRARELGYHLEPFWSAAPGMTPERLTKIFVNRGIRGILVAPIEEGLSHVDLDWGQFCAVSLCRNLVRPKINTVDHNHRQSMESALIELMKRGYRRPGFVNLIVPEEMNGWVLSSTLNSFLQRHSDKFDPPVPVLLLDHWDYSALDRWYRRHQPDVILSLSKYPYLWLLESSLQVPQSVGFLHFEAVPGGPTTGICQRFADVGIIAVDLLHLELLRDQRGLPGIRQSIGIDGTWVEGETLQPPPE
jgi:LacI family transcriptional regulator